MTQKLKISMLEAEIAQLKAELLTQTEIAKNNKDAYEEIYEKNIGYTVEIGELNQHITKLNGDVETLKGIVRYEIGQKETAQMSEFQQREGNRLLREANEQVQKKLDRIPNWIKWIFC